MAPWAPIVLSFSTAFAVSYLLVPHIIKVAWYKNLFGETDERHVHVEKTPPLGGIAIFSGVVFALLIWVPNNQFFRFQAVLSSFLIIFLVGVRDDIKPILPWKKFLGQLLAASIVVFKGNVYLKGLHGLAGLEEIPLLWGYALGILIVLLLINAFNLIDGINGLAGSIATLFSLTIGSWLYLSGAQAEYFLAFSLAGATIGFLFYNVRSKIFMGDTGSMLIGLIVAVLLIRFLEWNEMLSHKHPLQISSAPAIVTGLLILPLFDTLRVFVLRLLRGKSPFQADRTHLHHLLLDLGFSHLQATGMLLASNILIIFFCYYFHASSSLMLILLILAIALFLSGILVYVHRRHKRLYS